MAGATHHFLGCWAQVSEFYSSPKIRRKKVKISGLVHNFSAITRRERKRCYSDTKMGRGCACATALGRTARSVPAPVTYPGWLLVRTRQVALQATLAAAAITAGVELPSCVPVGLISGALTACAAAGKVVEQLAEAGTCSLSLEPLLPLTLQDALVPPFTCRVLASPHCTTAAMWSAIHGHRPEGYCVPSPQQARALLRV